MTSFGALRSISIYPIKGMRGIDLVSSRVERRGLEHDRRLVVVDASNVFLSQRAHPQLATLVPSFEAGVLCLRDAAGDSAMVPSNGERRLNIRVWRDEVSGVDLGDEIAEWTGTRVGEPVRLVLMDEESKRPIDPAYASPGDEVSFADGYPLLLANEASLDDLNRRMALPLPMNRFRPNLSVAGFEPWAEDGWERIRVGECEFACVKPCGRCLVTTTDQTTGERMGDEPLRTLATFRRTDGKVMFGENLIPIRLGTVRLGDAVEPLA